VAIDTVCVITLAHLDIGFTAPPDAVARTYKQSIDNAIQLCRENDDFYYTIETAWQLDQWLRRTDDSGLIEELVRFAKQGRIEFCPAFATQHSGLMSAESVNQLFYLGKSLSDRLGIPFQTCIQDDVPGYTWAYPQVMAKSGIKYFLTGINTGGGGGLSLPRSEVPFLWEGVDGTRILTWVAFDAYVEAKHWGLAPWSPPEMAETKVPEMLQKLEEAGYPHEVFLLMASTCDNIDAIHSRRVLEHLRRWNANHERPEFRLATPSLFFDHLASRNPERFPSYRGDWSGLWEAVKTSGPVGAAKLRLAQNLLPTAEKLHTLSHHYTGRPYLGRDLADGYRAVLEYEEHSAPGGGGWPHYYLPRESLWEATQHYYLASRAANGAAAMVEEALDELVSQVAADGSFLLVFNPLSWERTGPLTVSFPGRGGLPRPPAVSYEVVFQLVDAETGQALDFDRNDQERTISLVAASVPALGYRKYWLRPRGEADKAEREAACRSAAAEGRAVIENEFYRIEVETETGAVLSLFDRELGKELLPADGPHRFNQALEEKEFAPSRVAVSAAGGRTFAEVVIEREGTPFLSSRLRLRAGLKRVEITNLFDRQLYRRLGDGSRLSCTYVFPFALDGGRLTVIADGPAGHRRLPQDLLPGASSGPVVPNHFISLEDGETNVIFTPHEAILHTVGGPERQRPIALETPVIFSRRAGQRFVTQGRDGRAHSFDRMEPAETDRIESVYSLTSRGGRFDPVFAHRFGWEATNPLLARSLSVAGSKEGPLGAPTLSFFQLDDPGVLLLTLRRPNFGTKQGYLLRLAEVSGAPERRVTLTACEPLAGAALSNLLEEPQQGLPVAGNSVSFPVKPFETITLRLVLEKEIASGAAIEEAFRPAEGLF
jgi:hypothetical protein